MKTNQVVKTTSTSSIGIGTVLFLIFLVLKLIGVITWSWWWVTAPLWIPFALGIGIILGALGIMLIIALITALFKLF